MSLPYVKQVVTMTATASSATTAFVTTATINIGDHVIIAMGRTALSTTTNGALSVATSAGTLTAVEKIGTSCRASTFDVHQTKQRCTAAIPSGSTITLTDRSTSTKRGAVLYVIGGLEPVAAAAHNGNAADNTLGNVNGGSNGSSLTESSGTTTAAGEEYCMNVAAFSWGGTDVLTPDAGWTEIGRARTATGSADRGIVTAYKIVSTAGSQVASATRDSSGSWAACIASLLYIPFTPATLDFDNQTEGVVPSLSTPWAYLASSTATLAKAAAAKHGAMGVNIDVNAGGYTQMQWNEAATMEQRVLSVYVRLKTVNAASLFPFALRHVNTSLADVRINTDGTVTLRNNFIATGSTSAQALARDGSKWYRFEWMIKQGTDGQELRVYEEESATPLFTLTGIQTNPEHTQFIFGTTSYVASSAADFDTARVSNDWLGPFAPVTGPVFKEWNGTTWITLTPKEWNGTSWVTVNPKEL